METETKKKRRWLTRGLLVLLVGSLGLVAALPSIASRPAFHDYVTSRLTRDMAGNLKLDRLSLGWTRKPEIQGLNFSAPDGRPVLEVAECRIERTLLKLLTDRSTFGELHLVKPTVHLLLDERGNNIAAAARPKTQQEFMSDRLEDLKRLNENASGNVFFEQGCFVFQSAPERPVTKLAPINVQLDVHAAETPGAGRTLVLQPGEVFREIELTRALCNDLIQFVAPILARSSRIEGTVSLHTEGGTFPIKSLGDSTMSGQLTVHNITAAPGPLVTALAAALEVLGEVRLVDESVISFELSDQRVVHRGLRFEMGPLAVETEGTVGFDESLELSATVVFPPAEEGAGQLASRLAGSKIRLPIRGTITDPHINWAAIRDDNPFLDQLIGRVADPSETPILDAMRGLRKWRQLRQPADRTTAPRRDRPLARRLLQGLLDPDNQSAEEGKSEDATDD